MYKNIFSSSHQHPNQQKSTKKFSKFKMAQSIYLSMLKKFNHIPVLLIHHRNPFSKVSNLFLFQFCNFFISHKTWKIGEPNNNRHIETNKTGQSNFTEFRCWFINFWFNNFESNICNNLNKSNITKFSSKIKRTKA